MTHPSPVSRRAALAAGLAALLQPAAAQRRPGTTNPRPDVPDARYGPHARNLLDLWLGKRERLSPLVVFIHGGGFKGGDKTNLPPGLPGRCLESGFAVASVNYRYSTQAPFPAPMRDAGRAIQYLRSRAGEWGLDPARVAACGNSAGAGTTLWLGFRPEMADPASPDPVLRHSTRLTCMGVIGAQTSYDPRFFRRVVGGRAHEHPALLPFFGLQADEVDTPRAHALYEAASPINFVTADDPPVFMYYVEPRGPLPAVAGPGQGVHHIAFGEALRDKLAPLGIECVLRHRDDYAARGEADEVMHREMVEFFARHFRAAPDRPAETQAARRAFGGRWGRSMGETIASVRPRPPSLGAGSPSPGTCPGSRCGRGGPG